MSRIILASASPRRRELLSLITKDFEVITSDVDERSIETKILSEHEDMLDAAVAMTKALGRAFLLLNSSYFFSNLKLFLHIFCYCYKFHWH